MVGVAGGWGAGLTGADWEGMMIRMDRPARARVLGAVLASAQLLLFAWCRAADAQQFIPASTFAPINLGAALARENLRNLSLLPPVSNPGVSWELDPALDTYVPRHEEISSGIIDAPRFNRKGGLSLAVSFAYYHLDQLDGEDSTAVVVRAPSDRFNPQSTPVNLGIATQAKADVTLTRFSARYTLLDRLDFGIAIPLVTVDVRTRFVEQNLSGGQIGQFVHDGTKSPNNGNTLIDRHLNGVDFPGSFNEGLNFDVGNIILDSKWGWAPPVQGLTLGVLGALRLPSGSESHFTGTDTTSLKGVAMLDYEMHEFAFYLNGGYEYDFDQQQLSNGIVGGSVAYRPRSRVVLETGVRANFYQKDIDLYDSSKFAQSVPGTQVIAGNSKLGVNEATIIGGARFNAYENLTGSLYLSGPITPDGFRSDVALFLSVDYSL